MWASTRHVVSFRLIPGDGDLDPVVQKLLVFILQE